MDVLYHKSSTEADGGGLTIVALLPNGKLLLKDTVTQSELSRPADTSHLLDLSRVSYCAYDML